MPRGDKGKYTDKQKWKAEHIAEGYEARGVPEGRAEDHPPFVWLRRQGLSRSGVTMHDRAWQVPEAAFVAAWNGAGSLDAAVERVNELADGKNVPRWAVMARAVVLQKDGRGMKVLEWSAPRGVAPEAVAVE